MGARGLAKLERCGDPSLLCGRVRLAVRDQGLRIFRIAEDQWLGRRSIAYGVDRV